MKGPFSRCPSRRNPASSTTKDRHGRIQPTVSMKSKVHATEGASIRLVFGIEQAMNQAVSAPRTTRRIATAAEHGSAPETQAWWIPKRRVRHAISAVRAPRRDGVAPMRGHRSTGLPRYCMGAPISGRRSAPGRTRVGDVLRVGRLAREQNPWRASSFRGRQPRSRSVRTRRGMRTGFVR